MRDRPRPARTSRKSALAVQEKNRMWFNRYRTVDGYNVYGGRSQLSYKPVPLGEAKPVEEPKPISNFDVMQREMSMRDVMTANRDKRIWAVTQGGDIEDRRLNLPEPIPVATNKPGKKPDGSHVFLSGEDAIKRMNRAARA